MRQRIKLGFGVVVFLGLALNYSWLHAAMVVSSVDNNCRAQVIDEAAGRVADLFGEQTSTPWIRCLDKPHLGLGKVIGTTNFAPGLPAIILLNQDGHNVDVIAHEWAHAELAERIGVLPRTYQIPTWLDEGIAMQVDFRAAYGDGALIKMLEEVKTPILGDIESPSTFYAAGVQGRTHYSWSRCVVAELLKEESLASLIERALEGSKLDGHCKPRGAQISPS